MLKASLWINADTFLWPKPKSFPSELAQKVFVILSSEALWLPEAIAFALTSFSNSNIFLINHFKVDFLFYAFPI